MIMCCLCVLMINNVINEHIQNQLPIFLLSLKDMRLVRRSAIGHHFKSDIAQYIHDCVEQDGDPEEPQVLRDLTVHTKEWITEQTAYAIFSHRWLDEGELTFQDVSKFEKLSKRGFQQLIGSKPNRDIRRGADILDQAIRFTPNGPENMAKDGLGILEVMKKLCKGMSAEEKRRCQDFVKLVEFCNLSLQYGCNYVWFDTGCIDKSSSAELEESIRSMFSWYHNSKVCIVHLAGTGNLRSLQHDPWFTRGWTLQELLAPKTIKFFGKSWRRISPTGLRNNDKVADDVLQVPLWDNISRITGIPIDQLLNFTPGVDHAREALVWASKRQTTRIEDIAYCLIGLLDIPLSIAYGEGKMASYRLQVEILQRRHDMGLFAWQGKPSAYNSMLAEGPHCFSPLPILPVVTETQPGADIDTYTLTNRGLRIPLSVYGVQIRNKARQESGRVDEWVLVETSLRVEELGKIRVKSMNLAKYDRLEVAILRDVSDRRDTLAILLGFKNSRCERIITQEHIKLRRPTELRTPVIRFVE
ncbi:hypothetical protein BDZ97DRAFT_1166513 [Flammula alnicola]|nr:hypothetical protein BDZ97DRAFT_1166513 [Flammula alnicola]